VKNLAFQDHIHCFTRVLHIGAFAFRMMARVTVRNGSAQTVVPIKVAAATTNLPPVANAGTPQTVHP
jgi:hypothetical protein